VVGDAGLPDVVSARLATLTNDEEVVLLDLYLPALDKLEAAIPASGDLLDTKQAAVWHRNMNELAERNSLYTQQRLALCAFLGIAAGPGIPPIVTLGPDGIAVTPWLPPEVFVV
jgi:hypothetical protein